MQIGIGIGSAYYNGEDWPILAIVVGAPNTDPDLHYSPLIFLSIACSRSINLSFPKKISSSKKKVGDPNVPLSTDCDVNCISRFLISGCMISSKIFSAEKILEDIMQPEIKNRLMQLTSQSVERGTFGSPTFFLDEEIFFGKDKLIDLEHAIDRKIRGE